MGDGLRSVRLVTSDESLLASVRGAVSALEGWELDPCSTVEDLAAKSPPLGDVILLDGGLRHPNVYEACRKLTGNTRCRTFVVTERGNVLAEPIAHFSGATGVLERPLTTEVLRKAIENMAHPRPALPSGGRDSEDKESRFPEAMLRDLQGNVDTKLAQALTDSETGLFNYAFLNYKLEEEFKRASRFNQPLACVMLGFEGQASEIVLRELAGIFLDTSRDTDVLGRFDETSFLFLLPNTGQDGAEVMARRVGQMAQERNLRDLIGDALQIAVGISFHPHPDIQKREDLYAAARKAFFEARTKGGGVVTNS
jgi:diguanylate cyclase (GGDEF)-like protein